MFKKVKQVILLNKFLNEYNKLSEDISKVANLVQAKSLLESKTFWLNVFGLATTFSGFLPANIALPSLAILNILNRLVTNKPVYIFPPSPEDDKK